MTVSRTPEQIAVQDRIDAHYAQAVEGWRTLVALIGIPAICHERACGRRRLCIGRTSERDFGYPACFRQYREEVRYLLFQAGAFDQGREGGAASEEVSAAPEDRKARRAIGGRRGPTWLERTYGRSPAALARLRRRKGVPGPGSWEADPEGFARYMAAGDWRNPRGAGLGQEAR